MTRCDPLYLSDCHNASVYVVAADEGTNHYECDECKQPCNFHLDTTSHDVELKFDFNTRYKLLELIDLMLGADEVNRTFYVRLITEIVTPWILADRRRLLERVKNRLPQDRPQRKIENELDSIADYVDQGFNQCLAAIRRLMRPGDGL